MALNDLLILGEYVIKILIAGGLLLAIGFFIHYAYFNWQVRCFVRDVGVYLMSYQTKLSGNNRFLLNDTLLAEIFPEYEKAIIQIGWQEIIKLGWVYQDPYDRAWSVKITQI